jgi:hypothetical protein
MSESSTGALGQTSGRRRLAWAALLFLTLLVLSVVLMLVPAAAGRKLESFRKAEDASPGFVDAETGSEWDFRGRAASGPFAGRQLQKPSRAGRLLVRPARVSPGLCRLSYRPAMKLQR